MDSSVSGAPEEPPPAADRTSALRLRELGPAVGTRAPAIGDKDDGVWGSEVRTLNGLPRFFFSGRMK